MHEIVHCLQSIEHIPDASSWKSEHGNFNSTKPLDASRAEMNLVGAIKLHINEIFKENPKLSKYLSYLDKGMLEELQFYCLRLSLKHVHPQTAPQVQHLCLLIHL